MRSRLVKPAWPALAVILLTAAALAIALAVVAVQAQAGPSLTTDSPVVKPRHYLPLNSRGFEPGRDAIVWAMPVQDRATDGCATAPEDSRIAGRLTANSYGQLTLPDGQGATRMFISPDWFRQAGRWELCAASYVGGQFKPPTAALRFRIEYGLSAYTSPHHRLRPGASHVINILPPPAGLSGGHSVTLLIRKDGYQQIVSRTISTPNGLPSIAYYAPANLTAGEYTLSVTVPIDGSNQVVAGEFTVSPTIRVVSRLSTQLREPFSPPEYRLGDEVRLAGAGYAPGQAVSIYAEHAPPGTPSVLAVGNCRKNMEVIETGQADDDGRFEKTFALAPDRFNHAGIWRFCAMDGRGELTYTAAHISVGHRLAVNGDINESRLNAKGTTTIFIMPPLPAGSKLTGAMLQGRNVAARPIGDADSLTGLTVELQKEPSPYPVTLAVTVMLTDGEELTLELPVTLQTVSGTPPSTPMPATRTPVPPPTGSGTLTPPRTTVPRTATPPPPPTPGALFPPPPPGTPSPTAAPVPTSAPPATRPPSSTQTPPATRFPTATPAPTARPGSPTLLPPPTAAPGAGTPGPPPPPTAGPGLQGPPSPTGTQTPTRPPGLTPGPQTGAPTRYSLIIPNGNTVYTDQKNVAVQIHPPPPEGVEPPAVTDFNADGIIQPCTPAAHDPTHCALTDRNEITWTSVQLSDGAVSRVSVTVGGQQVSALVQVLPPLPQGETMSPYTYCDGLATHSVTPAPGRETRITFGFTIDSENRFGCQDAAAVTATMPSHEIEIRLHRDYQLPAEGTTVTVRVVRDNRSSSFKVPDGNARFTESPSADGWDTIVIPPCDSWLDIDDEPADCDAIQNGQYFEVALNGSFRFPTDADKIYPTEVSYQGANITNTIWDAVEMRPTISVVESRVEYGRSFEIAGNGFPARASTTLYGVNTLQDEDSINWSCRDIVQHDHRISYVVNDDNDRFVTSVSATIRESRLRPGIWHICAKSGRAVSDRYLRITIDYLLEPQKEGAYQAGEVVHIIIEPPPLAGQHARQLTIGDRITEFTTTSDAIHFTMPPNPGENVQIVAVFPSGLKGVVTVVSRPPPITAAVKEAGNRGLPGSLVRLKVEGLIGERVCDPTLQNVVIALWHENRIPEDNCVSIGPDRTLNTYVMLAAPDGTIQADLVAVFNDYDRATIKVRTDEDAELETEIALLRPRLDFRVDGETIRRDRLLQYRPVTVVGSDFPYYADHYRSPTVGYQVRDGESRSQTAGDDGEWRLRYRVTERTQNNDSIEFVPTINGHPLPDHSRILHIGVPSPTISISPSTVHTGADIVIKGENLGRFHSGYWLGILEDDRMIRLTDPDGSAVIEYGDGSTRDKPQPTAAGRTLSARSGNTGAFRIRSRFPVYEADRYRQGQAALELQLFNNLNEPIPGAVVSITHTYSRPHPTPVPQYVPTATPPPVFIPTPAPTRTPQPTPAVAPTATPEPTPTPAVTITDGAAGPPQPVDHRLVTATAAADGRSVELTWPHPTGPNAATSYLIERAETAAEIPQPVTEPHRGADPYYRDSAVVADREYRYFITAQNSAGRAPPDPAHPAFVRTPARPGPVPGLAVAEEPGLSIITVTWQAPSVTTVSNYIIEYRSEDETGWILGGEPDTYLRRWTFGSLRPGTSYEFRIAGVNAVGAGAWSEPITARTAGERIVTNPPTPTPESTETVPTPPPDRPAPEPPGEPEGGGGLPLPLIIAAIAAVTAAVIGFLMYRRYRYRRLLAQAAAPGADGDDDEHDRRQPEPTPTAPKIPDGPAPRPARPAPEPDVDPAEAEAQDVIARMMAELDQLRPERNEDP